MENEIKEIFQINIIFTNFFLGLFINRVYKDGNFKIIDNEGRMKNFTIFNEIFDMDFITKDKDGSVIYSV